MWFLSFLGDPLKHSILQPSFPTTTPHACPPCPATLHNSPRCCALCVPWLQRCVLPQHIAHVQKVFLVVESPLFEQIVDLILVVATCFTVLATLPDFQPFWRRMGVAPWWLDLQDLLLMSFFVWEAITKIIVLSWKVSALCGAL